MGGRHGDVRFIRHPQASDASVPLAAVAGDLVFYGGAIAAHPEHGVPDGIAALEGYPHHWSRINRELEYVYGVMGEVLADAGSSLGHTLKINSFHTAAEDVYEALRLRPGVFGDEPPPSTLVLVPELPVRDGRVALDTIALTASSARPRQALVASTANAPMPPHQRIWGRRIYSKAARGGGFLFTSGRTNNVIGGAGDDTARGHRDFPYRGDRAADTCRMILDYLEDVLASFGAGLGHVVKAEIHLGDMNQIAGIERVWRQAFPEDPPARIFVPAGFPTTYTTMEIEFIALDPAGPWDRETIGAAGVAPSRGHEPLAVRAGPYLFFSGLSASDGIHGLAPEARVDPAYPFHESQAWKEMEHVASRIEAVAGGGAATPLRRRVMMRDLAALGVADAAWRERLGDPPPTTAFRAGADLPVPSTSLQLDLVSWVG